MITEIALILVVILILIFSKFFGKPSEDEGNYNDIPLLKGFPLIGSVGDLFYSDAKFWKIMRKRNLDNYPIYRRKTLNTEIVYLLSPEDIEIVLSGNVKTSKGLFYETLRKFLGNGLITSEGDMWRGRRKLLTKSFHFSILQKYMKLFNEHLKSFIEHLPHNKPINILSEAKLMTLRMINDVTLGKDAFDNTEDEKLLKKFSESVDDFTIMSSYRSFYPFVDYYVRFTDLGRREEEALNTFKKFASKLIEEFKLGQTQKTEREFDTMTDFMLSSPEFFEETQDIKNELLTMNFAGHDTTGSGLSFALMFLASYPHFQKIIHDEVIQVIGENGQPTFEDLKSMKYLDRFVKESLRMYPPAVWIARRIEEKFITRTGYTIPAGKLVFIFIYDLLHNPRLFPDPEIFDPDRFLPDNISRRHPFAYIPFGAGSRNCIAQKFAFLELKSCICSIVQKFIVKSDKHIDEFSMSPHVVLKTNETMYVKFIPRNEEDADLS